MKRILSLLMSMIITLSMIIPSYALANTQIVPVFRYGNIRILVPPKGYNIEDDFREFVKKVSRTYYSGKLDGSNSVYDLNKYYYQASEVKHEWDGGGALFWSREDNPYSTAEGYQDYYKYNVPAIQSMLIQGIQEKADEIKLLKLEDYDIGLAADLQTGVWGEDTDAFIAQRLYDEKVSYEIVQTAITSGINDINLLGDVIMLKNGVDADEIWDWFCEIISKAWIKYEKLQYEQIAAGLSNRYREVLKQSVIKMYDYVEEQMLSDYRQLYDELNNRVSLTTEETLYRDQLKLLLKSIDDSLNLSLSPAEQKTVDDVAQQLVNNLGLEIQPVLTQEEITDIWVRSVISDVICVTFKTLLDNALEGNNLKEEIEINAYNAIINDIVSIATNEMLNLKEYEVNDKNCDGYYSIMEQAESLYQYIFSDMSILDFAKDTIVDVVKDRYKSPFRNAVEGLRTTWSELYAEFRDLSDFDNPYVENTIVVMKNTREDLEEAEKELKEATDEAEQIGVIVNDILAIVEDTLNLAKNTADLGDMADREVYFAHIANEMYHTMKNAESRRDSLRDTKGKYSRLKDVSNIDTADIELLKQFVNRVFSVYQMDMLGHNYYITLDYGWHYQTGGMQEDKVMSMYNKLEENYEQYNVILKGVLEFVHYTVLYPIVRYESTATSDYLIAVNEKYPWLSYQDATNKYSEIAEYAISVQVPDHLKQVGQ